jgi:hypothetical protein
MGDTLTRQRSTLGLLHALLLLANYHVLHVVAATPDAAFLSLDPSQWHKSSPHYDVADLISRPRAVVGYLSDQSWSFMEFLCMMHASWTLVSNAASQRVRIDLIVFHGELHLKQIQAICNPIDLESFELNPSDKKPMCYSVLYPTPPDPLWHGYPFINNVHFFGDNAVARLLYSYGYVMKSDFDVFLTPSFEDFTPTSFTFGLQEYLQVPETAVRIAAISKKMGLDHQGVHNLGPAWYVSSVPGLREKSELYAPYHPCATVLYTHA